MTYPADKVADRVLEPFQNCHLSANKARRQLVSYLLRAQTMQRSPLKTTKSLQSTSHNEQTLRHIDFDVHEEFYTQMN